MIGGANGATVVVRDVLRDRVGDIAAPCDGRVTRSTIKCGQSLTALMPVLQSGMCVGSSGLARRRACFSRHANGDVDGHRERAIGGAITGRR